LLPLAVLAALAAVVAADATLAVLEPRHEPLRHTGAPTIGTALDKALPPLPLLDAHGKKTSLRAFRGRWLVLSPSLTLCHEVCPLTTAALERVAAQARARGLASKVAVAETSVDPWRASPARLRAFKHRTKTPLTLLTGTKAQLRRLWRTLGVSYERTRGEGKDRDWWTGKPLHFDVAHTDGVFIIDPHGHLRLFVSGMPGVGRLPGRLNALLNDEGRHNLRRPASPWNVADLLRELWRLMDRPAPPTPERLRAATQSDTAALLPGGAAALRRRLAAADGRPVVVNAWASWCPPCRQELPFLTAASARFSDRVEFLGLNVSDNATAARRFLADHPIPYPSYADDDGAAARALSGLQGLPTTVFFDRSGRISYVHAGAYRSLAALEEDVAEHAG
jgi:protein SCO1/2